MKIYTRTGDSGQTQGPDGKDVRKTHPGIAALGEVDELNAQLGLCVQAAGECQNIADSLRAIQSELFALGATLAAPKKKPNVKCSPNDAAVRRMERQIDAMTDRLPELRHFVIPGGCELACRLHVARTVCRRAERAVVAAADAGANAPAIVLRYLNRLGDLLFIMARAANVAAGTGDSIWEG